MERTSLLRQDKRSCSSTLCATHTGLASPGRTCCAGPIWSWSAATQSPPHTSSAADSSSQMLCSSACLGNCASRSCSNLVKPGQYFVITLIFQDLPVNSLLLLPELLRALLVLLGTTGLPRVCRVRHHQRQFLQGSQRTERNMERHPASWASTLPLLRRKGTVIS